MKVVTDELVELLHRPETDVSLTYFKSPEAAASRVQSLARRAAWGDPLAMFSLSMLFAPTSELQDISLSSGWAQEFLNL